jgi:hypothetical protein
LEVFEFIYIYMHIGPKILSYVIQYTPTFDSEDMSSTTLVAVRVWEVF